jgi:hypothetical protein
MIDSSHFESRQGKLSASPEEVFSFVTDIRNFEQFIPKGTINNWNASKEECSFTVSMLGTVTVRLEESEKYSKAVFSGDALKKNDFLLTLHISDEGKDEAGVQVVLNAELNPMMKMIAVKPIGQFLHLIINEMEKFRGWRDIRE